MRRFLILILIALPLHTLYAQKVVVDGGKVIIDSRNVRPEGITITVKQTTTALGNYYTAPLPPAGDIASPDSDAKVYHYFEVAKKNLPGGAVLWNPAVEGCSTMADDGGGWRLPTRRELMLICVLHPQLIATSSTSGFEKLNIDYWSATHGPKEWSSKESRWCAPDAWFVRFGSSNGGTGLSQRSNISTVFNVRCIRDLTAPAK